MPGSSSTAHSTVYINSTASTEKLDSYSTARHPGTCSQPRQPRQLLDRSSTGSTGKASTAPRQRLDSRLDSTSTAPRRSLDSSTARQPGLNPGRATASSANRAIGKRRTGAGTCAGISSKRARAPAACLPSPPFLLALSLTVPDETG